MRLGINWVDSPQHVFQITCWLDVAFVIVLLCLWNRSLPLTSQAYYGQTLQTIKIPLEYVYRMGPEIMCTYSCKILTEFVGGGVHSVFWRKFEMAGNLYWRKWAWPIWGDASWAKESKEKGNFHITSYGSRVTGQKVKRAIIAPPWGRRMWLFFN